VSDEFLLPPREKESFWIERLFEPKYATEICCCPMIDKNEAISPAGVGTDGHSGSYTRLQDRANIEQTSNKCIQNTRAIARCLLDRVNGVIMTATDVLVLRDNSGDSASI